MLHLRVVILQGLIIKKYTNYISSKAILIYSKVLSIIFVIKVFI
jgi:hypothetical protein